MLAGGMAHDYSPTRRAAARHARPSASSVGVAWYPRCGMASTTPARPAATPEAPGPRAGWSVLLGAALGAAVGSACTLTLDKGRSCGDLYVDEEYGEECEPDLPDSYANACVGTTRPRGAAACDPESCTIVNTREQCAVCGDGIVDEDLGEECDGDNLNGVVCPGGVGTLQCSQCRFDTTYCQQCGNGILDEGEECDPNADPDDLVQSRPLCKDLEPYTLGKQYTSGQASGCRDDCRWDRSTCGYCNNGQIEKSALVDDGVVATPEQCDGEDFDDDALEETFANSVCANVDADLWPTIRICEGCFEITYAEDPREPCCVRPGSACPEEGGPLRCCSEIDLDVDPTDEGEPPPERCQLFFTDGVYFNACR